MLKTALIGLGRIGWYYHLPQIQAHEGFSLCAVVDPDKARLAEAKTEFGVRGYCEAEQMLREESPDVVVIASPTVFHEQQAIAAMRAGADVILDKPMTVDLAGAQRIAAVRNETGRKLVVYQPHRFFPVATVARRILQSGILGNVFEIKRASCDYTRRNDWQAFLEYGGGMLNNYGAHFIDQLLYLTGETVEKVFCQLLRKASLGDADDVVKLVLQTTQGTVLDLDISQAAAIPCNPFMMFGEYGAASLETDAQGQETFLVRYYDPNKLCEQSASRALEASGRTYSTEQLPWNETRIPLTDDDAGDFYAQCQQYFAENQPSPVPLEETLTVMRLIDRCRRMAAGETSEALPE